jgi:hypothetical protein
MRHHSHHSAGSEAAQVALAVMAGWTPRHRAIEAEAAELADVLERDAAARAAFSRRAAQ